LAKDITSIDVITWAAVDAQIVLPGKEGRMDLSAALFIVQTISQVIIASALIGVAIRIRRER